MYMNLKLNKEIENQFDGTKTFIARAGFEPPSERIFIFLIRNSLKPYPLGYKLPCKFLVQLCYNQLFAY